MHEAGLHRSRPAKTWRLLRPQVAPPPHHKPAGRRCAPVVILLGILVCRHPYLMCAHSATTCSRGRCRHCPYGHWGVKLTENRKNLVKTPTLLPPVRPQDPRGTGSWATTRPELVFCEVVFWSGGKDSYMALLERQRLHRDAGTEARFVLLVSWRHGG